MRNFGPLFQFSEPAQSAQAVNYQLRHTDGNSAELLELRTKDGTIYVRPSRWQRVRLQWTFRHFRVLPQQVLSRSDQRLIEKLSQSAVVRPPLPVTPNTLFGVVDQVRSTSPAPANRVATLRTEWVATQVFLTTSKNLDLPSSNLSVGVKRTEAKQAPVDLKGWGVVVAAVCIAVILASFSGIPLFSGSGKMGNPQAVSKPVEHLANVIKPSAASNPLPVLPAATSLPKIEKPKRWVAPQAPELTLAQQEPALPANESSPSVSAADASRSPVTALATVPNTAPEPAPIVPSATTERRFVSELPQGHFVHPVVSGPNLVGELQLKALIAADGSVKDVIVLSGSPRLAEAGMRAVRQWHYSPNQVVGGPAGMETQIRMSFYGQDAVSIASVANKGQTGARTDGTSTAP